jgi:Zn-dependent protease
MSYYLASVYIPNIINIKLSISPLQCIVPITEFGFDVLSITVTTIFEGTGSIMGLLSLYENL